MGEGLVLGLGDPAADVVTVGGKGAALAVMVRAGLPVPPGFHVTTDAYREFLFPDTRHGDPAAFVRVAMPPAVVRAVEQAYDELGGGPVAVRASVVAEAGDLVGQYDTFLGVTGLPAVLDAIRKCWASLWTDRAVAYRARSGVAEDGLAAGVVVQRMVEIRAAGVLCTANPVTGDPTESVVNASWGSGSGRINADSYVVRGGAEVRREVVDKAVLGVPVLETSRMAAVLDTEKVLELVALGERVRELYGVPVDVEWVRDGSGFALLQARPIAATVAEVWNDSLVGDFLWAAADVPSVMTPATWSLVRVLAQARLGDVPATGNIGGRLYLNLSPRLAVGTALGLGRLARRDIPRGTEMPALPMSRGRILVETAKGAIPLLRRNREDRRRLPELLARTPARCAVLRERIARCATRGELLALWRSDVDSLLRRDCVILDAGTRADRTGERLTAKLQRLAKEDAELLAAVYDPEQARLYTGETDRETYVRQWGHRCADEFEVSVPRPAEDPDWPDRSEVDEAPPEQECEEAWDRMSRKHPKKAARLRGQLDKAAVAGRVRERARSEKARVFSVLRAFLVRAGELTDQGDDVFMLTFEETLTLLAGDEKSLRSIPARREAYRRYRELPPYPHLISGRFELDRTTTGTSTVDSGQESLAE
ncbi:PEP/pyruvate-binding domain-containing protein [Actinokineospora enzanensis]|uniref:PEP/pyruvate-binding domain-containing protein n=1 Tax=Actinokineospora enzanensis TaxID=155975 RepID=UPI000366DDA0|nr:PEP/pyruvate-binding domain-containing protein [Actinokineospora enzanensis]